MGGGVDFKVVASGFSTFRGLRSRRRGGRAMQDVIRQVGMLDPVSQ